MKSVLFVGDEQAVKDAFRAFIAAKQTKPGRSPRRNRHFQPEGSRFAGQITCKGGIITDVEATFIGCDEVASYLVANPDWVVVGTRGKEKPMTVWSPENKTRQVCPVKGLEERNVVGISVTRDRVVAPDRVADLLTALLAKPQSCFSHNPKGTRPAPKPKPIATQVAPGHDGVSSTPARQFDRTAGYVS